MVCNVTDCTRTRYARGWCQRHYERWWHHGDPVVLPPRRSRVAKTECVYGHPFTPENTYRYPSGKRACRQCWRRHKAAYRRRLKLQGKKINNGTTESKRRYTEKLRNGHKPVPRRKVVTRTELLDVLRIEGGWWTVEGLAARLKTQPGNIHRTLYRMRGVERRNLGVPEWRMKP